MIETGQSSPDVRLYRAPGDAATVSQLWADAPVLLVFYLFDWAKSQ